MKKEKEELIEKLLNYDYIKSDKVKKAMLKVPREEFLPPEKKTFAYLDQPLGIGEGQTISAPHMVGMICEELDLREGMKILEIGTGLGYNAAVVAEVMGKNSLVYTIERIETLADAAKDNLKRTGYQDNVTVIVADGTLGYPEEAPYDRIYGTASAPSLPEPLKEQLKIGGILLVPVGSNHFFQDLVHVVRMAEDEYQIKKIGGVAFVPMIGKHGWPERK